MCTAILKQVGETGENRAFVWDYFQLQIIVDLLNNILWSISGSMTLYLGLTYNKLVCAFISKGPVTQCY